MPRQITSEDLERWFTSRHVTTGQADRIETLRDGFHFLAHTIVNNTRPGDDQQAAIRSLRSAMTAATATVFCEEEPPARLDPVHSDAAIDDLMRYLSKAGGPVLPAAPEPEPAHDLEREDAEFRQQLEAYADKVERLIVRVNDLIGVETRETPRAAGFRSRYEPEPRGPDPDTARKAAGDNLHDTIRDVAKGQGRAHIHDGAGGTDG